MDGGRGGFLARPAVQKFEREDREGQFVVPVLRSYVGFGGAVFSFMVGAVWFLWLVPAGSALTVAQFVGLAVAGRFLWRTATTTWEAYLREEQNAKRDDFQRRKWAANLGTALVSFLLVWMVGGLPKTWWFLKIRWDDWTGHVFFYTVQAVLAVTLMAAGLLTARWFHKETQEPHELTGKDRADDSLNRARLSFEIRKWEAERRDRAEAQKPRTFRVELVEDSQGGMGLKESYFELALEPERVAEWADAVLGQEDPDVTYERWAGKGKLFSRDQYKQLMDTMAEQGVVRERRGTTGKDLTRRGRRVLGGWLAEYEDA